MTRSLEEHFADARAAVERAGARRRGVLVDLHPTIQAVQDERMAGFLADVLRGSRVPAPVQALAAQPGPARGVEEGGQEGRLCSHRAVRKVGNTQSADCPADRGLVDARLPEPRLRALPSTELEAF